jgi:hypothetical protein
MKLAIWDITLEGTSLLIQGKVLKSRLLWCGHVLTMRETRNAYIILVGKLLVKSLLGRLSRNWEDNTKMDLQRIRKH